MENWHQQLKSKTEKERKRMERHSSREIQQETINRTKKKERIIVQNFQVETQIQNSKFQIRR